MHTNGPAIWGGCVTRRSIRAGSWYFSHKTVPVQGGYGALFAVQVQDFESIGRDRGTRFNRSPEFIPGYKIGGGHRSASWRIAVQVVSEPENCHGAGFKLRADARVPV